MNRGASGLLVVLVVITIVAAEVRGQCPPRWLAGEGPAGLDSGVRALILHHDGTGPAPFTYGRVLEKGVPGEKG